MSILAERRDAASADGLEREAFREFLKEQDMKSALSPDADTDRALEEYIARYGNLRFALSEGSSVPPLTLPPETEPAPDGEPAKAPPVSELSPRTRKRARRARVRNLVQVLNTVVLIAFWALLISVTVRFVEVPLNYILGALFVLPIVLLLVRRYRNAKHRQL